MDILSTLREPFLDSIIQAAPIAIIAVDKRLNVLLMNPRSCNYLNLPEEDCINALGKPITDFLIAFGASTAPIVNNLLTFRFNFDIAEVKLGNRYITVRCRPVKDGALMTFLSINNLKEKEAIAFNAILDGQELERKRFAQEIHDGIGPLLSTLKMGIEGLQLTDNTTEILEIKKEAKRLVGLVDLITLDIRSISHALLPPALVDYGLESALMNLCALVQRQSKIQVNCFVSQRKTRLEPTTELGLYRITQELLNNALKYASATNIAVQLIRHPNTVVLMVEDDGVGFNDGDVKKLQGIGFRNIMARVESMGGNFSLESAVGEGVLATVEVPLKLVEVMEN